MFQMIRLSNLKMFARSAADVPILPYSVAILFRYPATVEEFRCSRLEGMWEEVIPISSAWCLSYFNCIQCNQLILLNYSARFKQGSKSTFLMQSLHLYELKSSQCLWGYPVSTSNKRCWSTNSFVTKSCSSANFVIVFFQKAEVVFCGFYYPVSAGYKCFGLR